MTAHLHVVVAPGALPDDAAARDVLDRALAPWGASGALVVTRSAAELGSALRRVDGDGEVVLVAGGLPDLHAADLPGSAPVVRVDLDHRPRDPSPRVRRHLRGRGLDGLRYAVDTWYVHRTLPATRHAYGPHPDQYADLRLPPGPVPDRGLPVAVLVHGGYWRSHWEADLMEPVAADLSARGVATWNVEYRRPGDHGWSATTADVAAALAALATARTHGAPLDLGRVVTFGHSAGGQLVTRLAADVADGASRVRPALTVSLAGVLDLVEADRRGMGAGAVAAALGGHAGQVPDAYRASSPQARLPIGLPLAVAYGVDDDPDLVDLSRSFARAAVAAGDDVVVVEGPGDHFDVIDPRAAIWPAILGVTGWWRGPT